MRRILVDHARRHEDRKRGDLDEDLAKIVELRAFAGLTIEEAACVLDVSPSTAKREWRTARGVAGPGARSESAVTDERWQRTKALFQAAIERPADERAAFVAAAAGDDEDLRREVEALLASDAVSSTLERLPLADPAVVAAVSSYAAADDQTRVQMTFTPGSGIGPYKVVGLIGAGGMGQVYRARDARLNRDVALKVLPDLFEPDSDRMARLKREAQMLAALNHPNIAAIYGLEESQGRQALVLELVDGPTIADLIARGPMSLADAVGLARQIADALEAAHDKGIIHRDLKPANIKITSSRRRQGARLRPGQGVERQRRRPRFAGAPTLTATSLGERAVLGTPAYMSPEQARGRVLDKRTDIWSFGCVLFEMLTGRTAFGGETISDTIARVLERDVEWDALPASCPPRIRDLLRRCLQKDPSRRLRDIGDARLELDETGALTVQPTDKGAVGLTNRAIVKELVVSVNGRRRPRLAGHCSRCADVRPRCSRIATHLSSGDVPARLSPRCQTRSRRSDDGVQRRVDRCAARAVRHSPRKCAVGCHRHPTSRHLLGLAERRAGGCARLPI